MASLKLYLRRLICTLGLSEVNLLDIWPVCSSMHIIGNSFSLTNFSCSLNISTQNSSSFTTIPSSQKCIRLSYCFLYSAKIPILHEQPNNNQIHLNCINTRKVNECKCFVCFFYRISLQIAFSSFSRFCFNICFRFAEFLIKRWSGPPFIRTELMSDLPFESIFCFYLKRIRLLLALLLQL